ncbi:hypothetical protein ASG31_16675 [Chryseobacterium sp. Leaf404]|nr:hypothetical protein ASG31_16675 [Chryseobacterium sp. Leaf404]
MKKEQISIIAFIAVLVIGLIRFSNSSIYEALSTDQADTIQEYVKKSISWGIFFGASIMCMILLIKRLTQKLSNKKTN